MPAPITDYPAHLMRRVTVDAAGCWIWQGARLLGGYGVLRRRGKNMLAHRLAYELWKGPIPEGLHTDHLCRNRACINPDHLEAVTQRENTLRGEGACAVHARKTHCVHGHPLVPGNLLNPPPYAPNARVCRACREERRARRRAA